MKTLKTLIAISVLCFLVISCSKDEKVTYPDENPLDAFLINSGCIQKTASHVDTSGAIDYGFSFKPIETGKIKAFVVKIPAFNIENLRVILWDVATKKAIIRERIVVMEAGVATVKEIVPIPLTKDKEYIITIFTDDWYYRSKTDKSNVVYPVVAGNILVTGCVYGDGPFPTYIINKGYQGDVSFIFERTE